jgi:hypothetical protein
LISNSVAETDQDVDNVVPHLSLHIKRTPAKKHEEQMHALERQVQILNRDRQMLRKYKMKQLAKSDNMLLQPQVAIKDPANSCIWESTAAATVTHIIPTDSNPFAFASNVSLQNSGKLLMPQLDVLHEVHASKFDELSRFRIAVPAGDCVTTRGEVSGEQSNDHPGDCLSASGELLREPL